MAELGGQGGHAPPPLRILVGGPRYVLPPPPPKFCPLALQNGRPMVKIFAKMLLSTLKCAKFFACGELIWVELIPHVITHFLRANFVTL